MDNHPLDFIKIAHLVKLSYEEKNIIQEKFINNELPINFILPPIFIENEKTDTQAYIFYLNDKEAIITIPGTYSIQDCCTDLTLCLKNTKYGKIHKGFYDAWISIEELINEKLINIDKIYICGHSLGAAIGSIASLYLSKEGKIVENITFGCPRIGNYTFMKLFNEHVSKNYRFICFRDPVVRLPLPLRLISNYKHIDKGIVIDLENDHIYKKILYKLFVAFGRWCFLPLPNIIDHKIDNYIQKLEILFEPSKYIL